MNKITKILICGSIIFVAVIVFFFLNYSKVSEPVIDRQKIKIIEPISDEVNLDEFDYNECLSLLNKEELEELDQNENISCKSIIEKSIKQSPYKLERIANMNRARARHKAIKLNNGKVLIFGGDQTESAELFDPKTNKFTLITKSINPYLVHNVSPFVLGNERNYFDNPILLSNGKVYYQGAVYDPETNKFFKATSGKEKKLLDFFKKISSKKWRKQNNHVVINIFPDGKTLFAKDFKVEFNKALGCSQIYLEDPLENDKYLLGELNVKRDLFGSIILKDEKILIFGGQNVDKNGKSRAVNSSELYNPITGRVNIIDNIYGFKPQKINDEKVFFINSESSLGKGYNTSIFDLEKMEISPAVTLPSKFSLTPSIYNLNNNFLLVIEGSYANILDLNKNKVYKLMNPNLSSYGQTFTLLDNGDVLITGGNYIDGPVNSITELSKYAALLKFNNLNRGND